MKNGKLYSFTKKASKVFQVIMIAVTLLCVVSMFIVYFALNESVLEIVKENVLNGNISINEIGMSITELDSISGIRTAGTLACLYGTVICSMGVVVFGNINRIFVNTEKTNTPFTKDNVKLVKQIGVLSIAAPFVGLVVTLIMGILVKSGTYKFSLDMTQLFMGFVILCLSQFFAHGVELEDEVKGLL